MTADDVVFTYERILDPKTGAAGVDQLRDLSPGNIKKLDDLTVRFTLDRPNAVFWEALAFFPNGIVPVGYDPKIERQGLHRHRPVDHRRATAPASRPIFKPNPNYWDVGPYADTLTMIQFADSTARLNALLGGTVDHIDLVESGQTEGRQEQRGLHAAAGQVGRLGAHHHAHRRRSRSTTCACARRSGSSPTASR